MRAAARILIGAALLAGAVPANAGATPRIRHVFIIVEENEPESATFGPSSPAPYLAKTLRSQGVFVPNYYGIGHESNPNYLALISGQAPNPQTQGDCQVFSDFQAATTGAYGQATGSGCVYPAQVKTIADQLDSARLTWRDYNQSMGANPAREPAVCGHPGLNKQDGTQTATATDQYATRHNPFVYFHSIIDDTALCNSHVVGLDVLGQDLQSAASTPNYVFITPDLCSDGHDATCADKRRPGGYAGIDQFLKLWVPRITSSPAYRLQNGLLAIVFDESTTSDSTSCCGEIPGPNSPRPGINGSGGGDTGAVFLSPCIKPGSVTRQAYNHYSLLRSVEDIFGLSHLGYAQLPGEQSLGSDVFTGRCAAQIGGPRAHIRAPALASSASAGPRIRLSWYVTGASASTYTVQVRRTSSPVSGWRTLRRATRSRTLVFRARPGATYVFRAQASGAGAWAAATTVVPTGTRIPGGRYRGRWRLARVRDAWLGHAKIGSRGAGLALTYTGSTIRLVGDVWAQGGRARVYIDGRAQVIDLASAQPHARRVIFSRALRPGRHRLRLLVLGGMVPLEGVAVTDRTH